MDWANTSGMHCRCGRSASLASSVLALLLLLQTAAAQSAEDSSSCVNGTLIVGTGDDEQGASVFIDILSWIAIVLLVLLSGLFAGLTLGLLGLDLNGLSVILEAGTETEAKYARRIWPIRKRGNLLLCTQVLGNVAVNSALSILLADKTSGLVGFFVSTAVIVVFGEIVPQSICARHGLFVGAHTAWLVWIFLVFLFPVSYPIAKLLDFALGEELGTIYNKAELTSFLALHGDAATTDVTLGDEQRLIGVLEFATKRCADVLTPINRVFSVSVDETLDADRLTAIAKSGYSRIPVWAADGSGKRTRFVGLLLAKDLAMLDRKNKFPVTAVLDMYKRPLLHVWDDVTLDVVLAVFKRGHSHLAIVQRVNAENEDADPYYEPVGVITLENVLAQILQEEFIDKTALYRDNETLSVIQIQHEEKMRHRVSSEPSRFGLSADQTTGDVTAIDELTELEQKKICLMLRKKHANMFDKDLLDDCSLRNIIAQSVVMHNRGSVECSILRDKLTSLVGGILLVVHGSVRIKYARDLLSGKANKSKEITAGECVFEELLRVPTLTDSDSESSDSIADIELPAQARMPAKVRLFLQPGSTVICISPRQGARRPTLST